MVLDEFKLVGRIRHALFALYNACEHLPADEPTDSRLSVELRMQIERLRSTLAQIGDQATLTQFDAEYNVINRSNFANTNSNDVSIPPLRVCNERTSFCWIRPSSSVRKATATRPSTQPTPHARFVP